VRLLLPDLIDRIWNRQINPGKVFDLTLPLDQAGDAYAAMDQRAAINAPALVRNGRMDLSDLGSQYFCSSGSSSVSLVCPADHRPTYPHLPSRRRGVAGLGDQVDARQDQASPKAWVLAGLVLALTAVGVVAGPPTEMSAARSQSGDQVVEVIVVGVASESPTVDRHQRRCSTGRSVRCSADGIGDQPLHGFASWMRPAPRSRPGWSSTLARISRHRRWQLSHRVEEPVRWPMLRVRAVAA
jgi:hypothetical protein